MSVSLSIGVVSRRQRTYIVTCTATGGRLTTGSLTGPGLPDSGLSLEAEGSIGYTGENTYSVTSDTLSGDVGLVYTCEMMCLHLRPLWNWQVCRVHIITLSMGR